MVCAPLNRKKTRGIIENYSGLWQTWHFGSRNGTEATKPALKSSTAKLQIWTRIWGFRGPGFRSARQVLCGHLSSVVGRTELCHEVRNPGPQKPPNHPRRKPPLGTARLKKRKMIRKVGFGPFGHFGQKESEKSEFPGPPAPESRKRVKSTI